MGPLPPRSTGSSGRSRRSVRTAAFHPVWHDGTVSFFLVFLAIVLIGVVFWIGLGLRSGKTGESPLPVLPGGGFEQPPANLPPVLLPAEAAPEDVDRVRFSLGLRGYRMDQVDQVLDELRDQLASKQQEIDRLRAALGATAAPVGPESHGNGTAPEKNPL
jgi:DivIVA domain-containing protein